jgi:hypothetical protein
MIRVIGLSSVLFAVVTLTIGAGQVLALGGSCTGYSYTTQVNALGFPVGPTTMHCSGACPPEYPVCDVLTTVTGSGRTKRECCCWDLEHQSGIAYVGVGATADCYFIGYETLDEGGYERFVQCYTVTCPTPCIGTMIGNGTYFEMGCYCGEVTFHGPPED